MRNAGRVLTLIAASLTAGSAFAQPAAAPPQNFLQQQRVIDEKLAQERAQVAPFSENVDWQWGGWIDYYVFHFDDGVQESRVVERPGLAVWTRLSADNDAHQFFARMRMTYTFFEPGDQIERQKDVQGPNFDRAYYEIDFKKALHFGSPADPVQMKMRIGRQSVQYGTGYAFDLPIDAVWLDTKLGDFHVQSMFGKSIASYPNIDRSEPVDSHSHRLFYGVQATYDGWQHHQPFVYAIWNDDKTDERPKNGLQDYSYDSQYFGAGSHGEIVHNLNYWVEGVYESGHDFGNGNFIRKDYIDAWAFDAGLEYLFDCPGRPRIAGEYMFASGDSDRIYSPNSAFGGNRNGREDNSFVGFGWRDTGISASPSLSNIHIWKAGASIAPFEKVELLRDLEFGTNWFIYHKNHSAAAISDPTAQDYNGFVGWEMDWFINWRIASDISWTTRWGAFYPGSAYTDQGRRDFIFTGLTWSF
jgi:hypothetical protein